MYLNCRAWRLFDLEYSCPFWRKKGILRCCLSVGRLVVLFGCGLVDLSVCLSVGYSVSLSVCRSVFLSVGRSVSLSVGQPSLCLSVGRSLFLSVGIFVCLLVGLFVGRSVSLSVGLSVCRSVSPSTVSVNFLCRDCTHWKEMMYLSIVMFRVQSSNFWLSYAPWTWTIPIIWFPFIIFAKVEQINLWYIMSNMFLSNMWFRKVFLKYSSIEVPVTQVHNSLT